MKFSRIVSGAAMDIQENESIAEYRARNPVFGAWPDVRHVPDDTIDGATDNGDGTFTNPPAATASIDIEAVKSRGDADYRASVRMKAYALLRKGNISAAQLLLSKIGE